MGLMQQLVAFTGVAALLTVTPGLDTAFVLRTSATAGAKAACGAAGGIILGCFTWGVAAALGIGALLSASMLAFTLLRWVGAAYLVWMGFHLLLAPRRSLGEGPAPRGGQRSSVATCFRRGILTNLLNPKVGVFYMAFLPQFVPPDVAPAPWMILLALVHAGLGLIWFSVLIGITHRLAQMLRKPGMVAILDRVTGLVFLGFGARLALSPR